MMGCWFVRYRVKNQGIYRFWISNYIRNGICNRNIHTCFCRSTYVYINITIQHKDLINIHSVKVQYLSSLVFAVPFLTNEPLRLGYPNSLDPVLRFLTQVVNGCIVVVPCTPVLKHKQKLNIHLPVCPLKATEDPRPKLKTMMAHELVAMAGLSAICIQLRYE